MKKSTIITFIGVPVSLLVVFLLLFNQHRNSTDSLNFQQTQVMYRDLGRSVLATGIIKPKVGAEVRVGSRVSGIVKKLAVQIGDHVEKGQLLAELDPTEFQARYNQAYAAMENAEANFEYAKSELERVEIMFQKDLISQNDYDVALRSKKVAKSQVNQARADLKYAEIQLAYSKIKSPIAGIVASVFTQEGETVAASFSAPTFVTIIDLERLEVWTYVDEVDIGRIEQGQDAIFTVDTYPDAEFKGKVTAIFPKAEIQDNVVTYIVTIAFENGQEKILRPEMTTTVNIFLESRKNILSIPNQYVRVEMGKKYVYVLNENRPVKKWITTGIKNEEFTEVSNGIKEGDVVVLGDFESSY